MWPLSVPRPVYSIDALLGGGANGFIAGRSSPPWRRASAGLHDSWQCNSTTGAGAASALESFYREILDGPQLPSEQGWLGSTSVV
jgi:hypothetical protein